jgi:DNA gyrase subunit A
MGRAAKGRSIANLLELKAGEKVAALIRVFSKDQRRTRKTSRGNSRALCFFATQQGTVKKTALKNFGNVRKGGIIAIGIDPGDTLIDVKLTTGQKRGGMITHDGMSIRFNEEDARPMGRPAGGVRGINLSKGDAVVALAIVVPDATLLVAGEHGIGKRTDFEEYRRQSRGGKGIITMKTTDKTGGVVGALTVRDTTKSCSSPSAARWCAFRQRHPRGRPQHAGRQIGRPGPRRQTASHCAGHWRGPGRRCQ